MLVTFMLEVKPGRKRIENPIINRFRRFDLEPQNISY